MAGQIRGDRLACPLYFLAALSLVGLRYPPILEFIRFSTPTPYQFFATASRTVPEARNHLGIKQMLCTLRVRPFVLTRMEAFVCGPPRSVFKDEQVPSAPAFSPSPSRGMDRATAAGGTAYGFGRGEFRQGFLVHAPKRLERDLGAQNHTTATTAVEVALV
jgi:hypothetical protein